MPNAAFKTKETKKAREDVRISTTKIETLTTKLSRLRSSEPNEEDNRIFPFVYAGVIVKKDGQNLLTPMRYHCRPAGKPAFLIGNSRVSTTPDATILRSSGASSSDPITPSWSLKASTKTSNVTRWNTATLPPSEREQNVVLQFKPEPAQTMYIACLWSHWTDPKEPDLRGFAAITDEPPADVAAAGHDRCIINLKPEHAAAWLSPQNHSTAELQCILSDRAIPVFQHEILEAA